MGECGVADASEERAPFVECGYQLARCVTLGGIGSFALASALGVVVLSAAVRIVHEVCLDEPVVVAPSPP